MLLKREVDPPLYAARPNSRTDLRTNPMESIQFDQAQILMGQLLTFREGLTRSSDYYES